MSDRTAQEMRDDTVPLAMDDAKEIAAFLEKRKQLSFAERLDVVKQVIALLDGLYVHLPVKRAMYAVDPIRRLQLLKLRLERDITAGDNVEPSEQDDLWFHREMIGTLTSVRDLHTMYVLPPPFTTAIAFVPFQIECCFNKEDGARRYIITNIVDGLDWFQRPGDFVPGVEVLQWNDVKILRAVELVAENNSGSNPDARLARGLARLTIRPLARALPPDEECVTIQYRNLNGGISNLRVKWRIVVVDDPELVPPDGSVVTGKAEGIDYEANVIRSLTKRLYSPLYSRKDCKWAPAPVDRPAPNRGIENVEPVDVPLFHHSIQANKFTFGTNQYGHIRLRTFKVRNLEEQQQFVAEFARLVGLMPEAGLIIDIRDNPGGCIQVGERLLQVLTPREIEPEGAQCIATPLSKWLCNNHPGYFDWFDSVSRAVAMQAGYSLAYPLTAREDCNDLGQRYYGPVVLITSGLCYSTADIFAAGFKDHEIGKVLGVDHFTGAGGAEVLTYSNLLETLRKLPDIGDIPFEKLPGEVDLRFAVRRTLRVGENAGIQLEDLGVEADIPYRMSVEDLLWDNVDLLCEAVKVLSQETCYCLRQAGPVERAEKTVAVKIETQNLAQLDIAIDGWKSPSMAVAVELGQYNIEAILPPDGKGKTMEIRGYDKDKTLVAVRRVPLPDAAPASVQR